MPEATRHSFLQRDWSVCRRTNGWQGGYALGARGCVCLAYLIDVLSHPSQVGQRSTSNFHPTQRGPERCGWSRERVRPGPIRPIPSAVCPVKKEDCGRYLPMRCKVFVPRHPRSSTESHWAKGQWRFRLRNVEAKDALPMTCAIGRGWQPEPRPRPSPFGHLQSVVGAPAACLWRRPSHDS